MLGAFDPELNDHSHAANIRKSIRLIAKVSTLINDGYRIAHGKSPLPEREDLTLAGNLFYKLRGEVPQDWQIQMMDTILILYADHEFNASTFAARVTASTLADIYAAVTSACAALKGPLHGGANEQSMRMLDEIKKPDRAEGWLKDQLAKKAKIMDSVIAFTKRAIRACRSCARLGAPWAAYRQRKLDSDLREARANDGARKTFVRQCGSLRRAGVHNAGIRSGAEHADLCRVARCRLVRACGRAA